MVINNERGGAMGRRGCLFKIAFGGIIRCTEIIRKNTGAKLRYFFAKTCVINILMRISMEY